MQSIVFYSNAFELTWLVSGILFVYNVAIGRLSFINLTHNRINCVSRIEKKRHIKISILFGLSNYLIERNNEIRDNRSAHRL